MHVSQRMTTGVPTATAETSLLKAQQLLNDGGFSHLAVLGSAGRLIGVISQAHLLSAIASLAMTDGNPLSKLDRVEVGDYMVNSPQTIGPEKPIADAVLIIRERRIGCLPVVDPNHQLLGMLTERNLFDLLLEVLGRSTSGGEADPATS